MRAEGLLRQAPSNLRHPAGRQLIYTSGRPLFGDPGGLLVGLWGRSAIAVASLTISSSQRSMSPIVHWIAARAALSSARAITTASTCFAAAVRNICQR